MATRPKHGAVDHAIDRASEALIDAHGLAAEAQHVLYNAYVAVKDCWERVAALESALAGRDPERTDGPGELFMALAELRELPAIRRASWDGTERRVAS